MNDVIPDVLGPLRDRMMEQVKREQMAKDAWVSGRVFDEMGIKNPAPSDIVTQVTGDGRELVFFQNKLVLELFPIELDYHLAGRVYKVIATRKYKVHAKISGEKLPICQ